MEDLKNKLYNYEAQPPEQAWHIISRSIQTKKPENVTGHRQSKIFFYSAAAAACIVLILFGSVFIRHQRKNPLSAEKSVAVAGENLKDSMKLNHQILESIIKSPKEKQELIANSIESFTKKYLTVSGPEGQPVKISPKVATLIVYADNEFPPRPVWSNKICKWQEIMLSSTIAPTSANLVDLMQMAARNEHIE